MSLSEMQARGKKTVGAWQIQPASDNKKALVKPCKSVENTRKKNPKDDISTQSTTTTP